MAQIMGIDYGSKRVGVALGDSQTRLARPLVTLRWADGDVAAAVKRLCAEHEVTTVVMGLPRGLEGQETAQTAMVREAAAALEDALGQPVLLQDEALTSEVARERLLERGQRTDDGAIDREAAAIILQDYLDAL